MKWQSSANLMLPGRNSPTDVWITAPQCESLSFRGRFLRNEFALFQCMRLQIPRFARNDHREEVALCKRQ